MQQKNKEIKNNSLPCLTAGRHSLKFPVEKITGREKRAL